MKKALIAGITGQDGSYPAELLLKNKEDEINTNNTTGKTIIKINSKPQKT